MLMCQAIGYMRILIDSHNDCKVGEKFGLIQTQNHTSLPLCFESSLRIYGMISLGFFL